MQNGISIVLRILILCLLVCLPAAFIRALFSAKHKRKKNFIHTFSIVLLFSPIILIAIWVLYEIFGMGVNHIATKRQTEQLQANLENTIPDIQIVDIYSETGNTSGTGNHVDCLSSITFSTQLQKSEIEDSMSEFYTFNEWNCYVKNTDDGYYLFYINTSAPFIGNIEGH
ncbi:hypothetical protein [Clostridium sp. AM58-1XD]|uniref:hypothetical protein n=1 Tax=Clostridium sp. AM58-1XD TaxID=2292307 RepID=UPI000E4FA9A2|nr:hypothetical protein [Clostridium sp. AM58-1XD]RGY99418.1 hypothetical protein DXA13_07850 [Clostridium sp. AM58-1XD]